MPEDENGRLDFGIFVGVLVGEELDRARVHGPEAGRRVRHALANDLRDEPGEYPDADAAGDRRAVRSVAGEPRADGDVGAPGEDRLEKLLDLAGVVLTVHVNLDR